MGVPRAGLPTRPNGVWIGAVANQTLPTPAFRVWNQSQRPSDGGGRWGWFRPF